MKHRNDNPEWTQGDFNRSKQIVDLPKEMQAALRKIGRPKSSNPKQQITLRLSADIVEHLKSTEAYMPKIEALLRKGIEQGKL